MINDTRRDAIYEEMNKYVLELGDPLQYGPRYYMDKIAMCRNYLNAVSLVISELSREKLVCTSELRKLETIYELECAKLLATDEHVKRLANIKDRESTVMHILRDKRQRIDFLKDQLVTVDGVFKYVSHRSRELHGTMDAIKNQRRFMQIEVSTGAFYGDERVPEHEVSVGMGPAGVRLDFDEKEIRGLIDEVPETEIAAALEEAAGGSPPIRLLPPAPPVEALQEPPVAQETAVVDDDEAIARFLGDTPTDELGGPTVEPSPSVVQTEDTDLSTLLDSV
jgi:hypothetical protein